MILIDNIYFLTLLNSLRCVRFGCQQRKRKMFDTNCQTSIPSLHFATVNTHAHIYTVYYLTYTHTLQLGQPDDASVPIAPRFTLRYSIFIFQNYTVLHIFNSWSKVILFIDFFRQLATVRHFGFIVR